MSNCCPYCDSENFENEATQESKTEWVNRCRNNNCKLYSMFDEELDAQVPFVDEDRQING